MNQSSMDGENIEFRRLQPGDKEAVQILCRECFPVSYPDNWYEDITSNDKYYTQAGVDPNGAIVALIVAEEKSLVHCHPDDATVLPSWYSYETHVVYILSLGVSAKYRRKGTARMLVCEMLRTLLSPNFHSLGSKLSLVQQSHENLVIHIDPTPQTTFSNGEYSPCPSPSPPQSISNTPQVSPSTQNYYLPSPSVSGWGPDRGVDSEQPCKAVYLHVLWSNRPAIRLYEQIGFVMHRKLPDYYFIAGSFEDAYLYVLYINGGEPPPSALELVLRSLDYCWASLPVRCTRSLVSYSLNSTLWLLATGLRLPLALLPQILWRRSHRPSPS